MLVIQLFFSLQFCFTEFEEEGVDCIEALDWLTSCNLYTAIISSTSELQDVLSKPGNFNSMLL